MACGLWTVPLRLHPIALKLGTWTGPRRSWISMKWRQNNICNKYIYIVHSETKGARYGIAQLQIKGLLPNSKTSKTKIADRLFARTAFVNTTFSIPDIGVFAAGWMMPEVYVLTMWSAMRLYDCACLWFMIFMSTIQWPFLSEYWEFTTFFVDIPESSHKNHCAVLMISDGHFRMGFWHFGSHITMDDRLECLRIY